MKRILLVVLLVSALAISVMPALAIPVSDLNDLARYFPADTAVFAAARIDDAFFSELDGLIAKIAAIAPPGSIPPMSIVEELDKELADADPPLSFQEDIRPWLGNTVAFGVLELPMEDGTTTRLLRSQRLGDDAPVLVAVAINDRATVTDFLVKTLDENSEEYERTDEADYTIIDPVSGGDDGFIVIRDDVLLVSNLLDVATTLPDGSLSTSATFTDTFALLPESDYNVTAFINLPQLLDSAAQNDPDFSDVMGVFGNLFTAIGPQAWGATILDGASLTLDVAQKVDTRAAYEALGLPTELPGPIDPAFAARIPADTPLAFHSTNLGFTVQALFTMLDNQIEMMGAAGADADEIEEMKEGIAQIEASFMTFTGLDLREDVFNWMTGDHALFIKLNPELDLTSQFGLFQAFPVDFGLAVEVTDPAAAAATVDGLVEGLERLVALMAEQSDSEAEAEITTETMVGADVSVLTITASDLPWPLELLIGANDEVFALGTRNAVSAIFSRDGGLPSNPAYVRAQNYVLPEPYSVAYLGTEGLLPLADLIEAFAQDDDEEAAQNAQAVRDILNLFPSGTISQRFDANGNSISRLVLMMAE